jgi:hypothetical protein
MTPGPSVLLISADVQIFLQREQSEDALDFWLDVQQHENMCKAYFKVCPPSENGM